MPDVLGRRFAIGGDEAWAAVHSELFAAWVASLDEKLTFTYVYVQSVDWRKGEGWTRHAIFIKFKVDITDQNGKKLPGVVMLRGKSIGVLVVLKCEGKEYALLVSQNRPAVGKEILEMVAGMFDQEVDPKVVAAKEVLEETGLTVPPDLFERLTREGGAYSSPGLLDEEIELWYTEVEVSQQKLEELKLWHGGEGEMEHINLRIVPLHELSNHTCDLKTLLANALYAQKKGRSM